MSFSIHINVIYLHIKIQLKLLCSEARACEQILILTTA